ncbi:MAG: ankyrin repeat domain-containing protein [Alteraurantiacibacter sp.]
MVRLAFRTFLASLTLGFGLAAAAPAAAQAYSEGYQFLEAVKDREGQEATEMLREPGTTVINARDLSSGETGLHITIGRRDLTWTRWLLQEGANPNVADNRGRTPLMAAIDSGFLEAVEVLLNKGAQVDTPNRAGETPLITAVLGRNTDLLTLLLENGANPDRTDNTGRSARDHARQPGVPPRILSAIEASDAAGNQAADVYGPVQ